VVGTPAGRAEELRHDGRATAYRVADRDAPDDPVVFVHGAGGSGRLWRSQFRLADRFPVVTVDLSGHGDSEDVAVEADDPTDDGGTFAAYAADVAAVADAVDAERFVGSSMGGAVLLHGALDRDLAPRELVLAGTGAHLPVNADLRESLATDEGFERAVEVLHGPGWLFHDPEDRLVAASATLMGECGRAVCERDYLACHRFDVRDRLGEVGARTLAVVGEHDRMTPPASHETLQDGIPDCRLERVADAGHLAMLERPAAINDLLVEFLQ
jgi:pimeloyl-ACP methyl ester carboxylesterase